MELTTNNVGLCWSFLYTANQMGTTPDGCLIDVLINGKPAKDVEMIDDVLWGEQWFTLERKGVWSVDFEREYCENCDHMTLMPNFGARTTTADRSIEPFWSNRGIAYPLYTGDDYLMACGGFTIMRMTGDLNQMAQDILEHQRTYLDAMP